MTSHCSHCRKGEPETLHKHASAGLYTCPMHLEIIQNGPGFCPICAMSLEPLEATPEIDDNEYKHMRIRFWISLACASIVMLLAMGHFISPPLSGFLQLVLSTAVVLGCGWPFFQRAFASLLKKSLNMFTLISLGVGSAYLYSAIALLFPEIFPESFKEHGELPLYFETAAMIITLVLLGQVFELKAKNRTGDAIKALFERAAKSAHLIRQNEEIDVPINEINVHDILRVKPGEKVPLDGIVIEGSSYIDESMISGEPTAVNKSVGSKVVGGTINQTGSFLMQVQFIGKDTLLSKIIQMVSEAQKTKAPIQQLADTVSAYFVPFVLFSALLTFIIWYLIGPLPSFAYAITNAIAVLIIACPCALGLATPMSIVVGVGLGAEKGILIKNGEALEKLEAIDTLVIDKTGTLTEGKPRVIQIVTPIIQEENALLALAASVEQHSEHPLASAIIQEAASRNLTLVNITDFFSVTGGGIGGTVDGNKILAGTDRFLSEQNISIAADLLSQAEGFEKLAQTIVFVAYNNQVIGFIAIGDSIKKTTAAALNEIKKMGIKIILLTGDNSHTAAAISKELGIDDFQAAMTPAGKKHYIETLKQNHHIVAMAGDGINDAPAIAAADVGIAMGNGTDVAIKSASVTLLKGDLLGIERAIVLSRQTMKNIRQNLFFAFIYNLAGVPIAAGILYPLTGMLLSPMIAAAAMALSSISVIGNALRLRKK